MDDIEDVTLTFTIPENAEIYTYPLTLKGTSNVKGIFRTYKTEINLLIQEKDIEETTTTTLPEESEEKESPLTGSLTFIKANKISIIVGVGLAGLMILLVVFKGRLPKIQFKLRETKQDYSFRKGWKEK